MSRTWTAKIGYLFARQAFEALREKMDPRKSNGGVFLGLDGVVIKSHGGTDALGFANAIGVAVDMHVNGFLAQMREELSHLGEAAPPPKTAARSSLSRSCFMTGQMVQWLNHHPSRRARFLEKQEGGKTGRRRKKESIKSSSS